MIWAIVVAGAIILTAAALDHAYNGFDDDDDDEVEKKETQKK